MLAQSNPWLYIRKGVERWIEGGFSALAPKQKPKLRAKLEQPPEGMGDFALPLFEIASKLKISPERIAETLLTENERPPGISKMERAGGYLNFWVDSEYLTDMTLNGIINLRRDYGFSFERKKGRIILEHTSANPNGPLHVGRARNPIIGDTIARLLRANGYDVTTEYYVNDSGMQVATLVWGHLNLDIDWSESSHKKADHRYVRYYQETSRLPDSEEGIRKLLKDYEDGDPEAIREFKIHEEVLEGIIQSLEEINIKHDSFVHESKFLRSGDVAAVVEKLRPFCKSEDGSLYLEIDAENVYLTRRDGTTLYIIRDVAYHLDKFKRCDIAINILGEDHKLESKQLGKILDLLGKKKPLVIFYSFISLHEGKMSTRRGNIVYLDDLVDESISRAREEVKKRRPDLDEESVERIARAIGPSAVRYNIIKVQPQKQIEFRWEEALSFEGDSAPFAQYAHARCSSILRKLGEVEGFEPGSLINDSEIRVIKTLATFPSLVEEICDFERPRVHLLTSFLYDLARGFNQFYRDCPVIKAEEPLRSSRAALVMCVKQVTENCANLLGLEMPGEM